MQRRYQNLERDLKPLDDRMRNLKALGEDVKRKNPECAEQVDKVLAELTSMHKDLLRCAKQRISEAEQSQGQQMFEHAARYDSSRSLQNSYDKL